MCILFDDRVYVVVIIVCQILEKGPAWVQSPVLNIVYCLLHYTDITGHTSADDMLAVIAKYMEVNYILRMTFGFYMIHVCK